MVAGRNGLGGFELLALDAGTIPVNANKDTEIRIFFIILSRGILRRTSTAGRNQTRLLRSCRTAGTGNRLQPLREVRNAGRRTVVEALVKQYRGEGWPGRRKSWIKLNRFEEDQARDGSNPLRRVPIHVLPQTAARRIRLNMNPCRVGRAAEAGSEADAQGRNHQQAYERVPSHQLATSTAVALWLW